MTKYIKCGGGGLPPQVIVDMNAVLNKKFGTSTDYPSSSWPSNIEKMTALPEETASGSIAHFTDGADDVPIKSGIFEINPYQEGTGDPSLSNPRTIHGYTSMNVVRCGKNLFDKSNASSILNCYITSNTVKTSSLNRVVWVACNPNATYTVSKTSGKRFVVGYSTETPADNVSLSGVIGNNESSSITITTGANAKFIAAWVWSGSNDTLTAQEMINSVQIEQSATSTTYAPYTATTYPISWQTEAGTVYGGELNATTGVLTIGWIKPVVNWVQYNQNNGYKAYRGNSTYPKAKTSTTGVSNIIKDFGSFSSTSMNKNIIQIPVNQGGSDIYCALDENVDISTLDFVYQLDEPTTEVQLTPQEVRTLLGENNIWHDCNGDSTVEYRADIDLYVAEHS